MAEITAEALVAATFEVLEERGDDFVYVKEGPDVGYADVAGEGSCVYSADGGETGSCLFGKALIEKLGVEYHTYWEDRPIQSVLEDLLTREDHLRVAAKLGHAQASQDGGKPYGEVKDYLRAALEG